MSKVGIKGVLRHHRLALLSFKLGLVKYNNYSTIPLLAQGLSPRNQSANPVSELRDTWFGKE